VEAQHDDHEGRAGPPEGGEEQQQDDAGEREREVGEREQNRSREATREPRDRSHHDADRDRHEDRERADAERDARSVDEPGPHVPAEAVGAERVDDAVQVGGERRQEPRGDDVALGCRIPRGYHGRGDGA